MRFTLSPSWPPIPFASLWLSPVISASFQKKVSLFYALCGYFSLPLRASVFFHCLSTSPLFLPFTLSVTALCCFLSLCHWVLRSCLTASQLCLSLKTGMKSVFRLNLNRQWTVWEGVQFVYLGVFVCVREKDRQTDWVAFLMSNSLLWA